MAPNRIFRIFDGRRGVYMDKQRAWRPRVKSAPLFNPFEATTEWTAQIGGNDRIEVEDEVEPEEMVTPDPATKTTDDKGSPA
jgi:hypothetical protein